MVKHLCQPSTSLGFFLSHRLEEAALRMRDCRSAPFLHLHITFIQREGIVGLGTTTLVMAVGCDPVDRE